MKPLRKFLLQEFRINVAMVFVAATFRLRSVRRLKPAATIHGPHYFGIVLLITACLLGVTTFISLREANGQTKSKPGLSYGRNPFLLPSGVRVPANPDSTPVKHEGEVISEAKTVEVLPPPLKVKAILIGEHARLASIDQQIVAEGDRIHDEKVLEIKSDRVILEKGIQKRSLFLSQSTIHLNVEER